MFLSILWSESLFKGWKQRRQTGDDKCSKPKPAESLLTEMLREDGGWNASLALDMLQTRILNISATSGNRSEGETKNH